MGARSPVVAALLVGMILEGCSADAGGGGSPAVRDSAGIRIVETGPGAVPTPWSAEEVVSIGSMDGPPETTFNRVGDLAVGPDGGVYVLDAGDQVVKAYDPRGAFLFEVGGQGDGPSEFRGASRLIVQDGGFAVFDYRAPKVARFAWDGTFDGSTRTEFSVFEYGFPEEWVEVPGGAVVVLGTGCSMPPPEDRRPKWKLLTLGPDGSVRDTVALRDRHDLLAIYGERFCTSVPALGGPRNSLALRADGTAAFGDGAAYEVAVFNLTADTARRYGGGTLPTPVRLIRRNVEPSRITEQEIETYRTRWTTSPEGRPPPDRDRLEAFETAWDSVGFPRARPYFDALLWDDQGRLWVGRVAPEEAELRTWDVFSEEGELLGAVELPAELRVMAVVSGIVWGIRQDDLGVMYVKGYRVEEASVDPASG